MLQDLQLTETVSKYEPRSTDQEIIDKILDYWKRCTSSQETTGLHSIWTRIIKKQQNEFILALNNGDRDSVLNQLSNYWVNDLSKGYSQHAEKAARFEFHFLRSVVSLAEAVGATRHLKQGMHKDATIAKNVHELADKIAKETGVELGIKNENSGGMWSFEVDGRPVSPKDVEAYLFAYCGARLRNGGTICEIGAGAGHSAYYHRKFGASKVCLFDLPSVSVTSIWVLGRLEGTDAICMYGDTPNEKHKYFIYPHFLFGTPVTNFMRFDTLVNKNSFTEMPLQVASDYFSKSEYYGCSKIFSTNQEYRPGFDRLTEAASIAGWQSLSRSPNWIRSGFVDEIFVAPDRS